MNYTSKELSQKIMEVGFSGESEKWWFHYWEGSSSDLAGKDLLYNYEDNHDSVRPLFPAYDLIYDICIKYRDVFFRKDGEYCYDCEQYTESVEVVDAGGFELYWERYCKKCKITTSKSKKEHGIEYLDGVNSYTKQILTLLQQGKIQEAENYIEKHSILFNK